MKRLKAKPEGTGRSRGISRRVNLTNPSTSSGPAYRVSPIYPEGTIPPRSDYRDPPIYSEGEAINYSAANVAPHPGMPPVDRNPERARLTSMMSQAKSHLDNSVVVGMMLTPYSSEAINNETVFEYRATSSKAIAPEFTLDDPRFGAVRGRNCPTCGGNYHSCPGHRARIILNTFIWNPIFIEYTAAALQCVCMNCYNLLIHPDTLINTYHVDKMPPDEKRLQFIRNLCTTTSVRMHKHPVTDKACPQTPIYKAVIDSFNPGIKQIFGVGKDTKEKDMDPKQARTILAEIDPKDLELLGFKFGAHPKDYIMDRILVEPPCSRQIVMEGSTVSTDAKKYKDLSLKAQQLGALNAKGVTTADEQDKVLNLRKEVATLYNEIIVRKTGAQVATQHYASTTMRPIMDRLKGNGGKRGPIRSAGIGARVNLSGRSVIGLDAYIDIDEIAIPWEIAKVMTVPDVVTEINVEKYRKDIEDGLIKTVAKKGRFFSPKEYMRSGKKFDLEIGDVIHRPLKDGDWIVPNRQPTLSSRGIMAFKARIFRNRRNIGLRGEIVTSFNADFDGDEMTLHAVTSKEAQAEAMILMNVLHCLLGESTNAPVNGPIFENVSGGYLLSMEDNIPDEVFTSMIPFSVVKEENLFGWRLEDETFVLYVNPSTRAGKYILKLARERRVLSTDLEGFQVEKISVNEILPLDVQYVLFEASSPEHIAFTEKDTPENREKNKFIRQEYIRNLVPITTFYATTYYYVPDSPVGAFIELKSNSRSFKNIQDGLLIVKDNLLLDNLEDLKLDATVRSTLIVLNGVLDFYVAPTSPLLNREVYKEVKYEDLGDLTISFTPERRFILAKDEIPLSDFVKIDVDLGFSAKTFYYKIGTKVAEDFLQKKEIVPRISYTDIKKFPQTEVDGKIVLAKKEDIKSDLKPVTIGLQGAKYRHGINPKSRLGRKLTAYGVPPFSGRALFSLLLPPNFNYNTSSISIIQGVMIRGFLTKSSAGIAQNCIIHRIYLDYGPLVTKDFIQGYNIMIMNWLKYRAISTSLMDCKLDPGVSKEIEKDINEAIWTAKEAGVVVEGETAEDKQIRERKLQQILNISKIIGEKIINSLDNDNALGVMAKSGAKGSALNIGQITKSIGQIYVSGQRIQPTLPGGRCFIEYEAGELDPRARGFCVDSYYSGFSDSASYKAHLIASRREILSTATGTADVGYSRRKEFITMEEIVVSSDSDVRNPFGREIMPIYGGDGFRPSRLFRVVTDREKIKRWKRSPESVLDFIDISSTIFDLNMKYGLNEDLMVSENRKRLQFFFLLHPVIKLSKLTVDDKVFFSTAYDNTKDEKISSEKVDENLKKFLDEVKDFLTVKGEPNAETDILYSAFTIINSSFGYQLVRPILNNVDVLRENVEVTDIEKISEKLLQGSIPPDTLQEYNLFGYDDEEIEDDEIIV